MQIIGLAVIAVLLITCLFLFMRNRELKNKIKNNYSIDARQLLHDISRNSSAVVRVEVLDATQLFMRKP